MPQMGESVTEGTILEWHVAEGEEVAEGDTVVEVSTDKIDAEVPAPASGVITKILAQADDTVEVGQALAQIDPNGSRSGNGAGPTRRREASRRPGRWAAARATRTSATTRSPPSPPQPGEIETPAHGREPSPRLTRPPPDAKRRRRAERWLIVRCRRWASR